MRIRDINANIYRMEWKWHMKNVNEMRYGHITITHNTLDVCALYAHSCIFLNIIVFICSSHFTDPVFCHTPVSSASVTIYAHLHMSNVYTTLTHTHRHDERYEVWMVRKHVRNVINKRWKANIWKSTNLPIGFWLRNSYHRRHVISFSLHCSCIYMRTKKIMITFVERCHFSLIISYLHIVFYMHFYLIPYNFFYSFFKNKNQRQLVPWSVQNCVRKNKKTNEQKRNQ